MICDLNFTSHVLNFISFISSLDSRHLLYLQLRKNVLEQQILCTEDDLITLGGLALQAEIGDFKDFVRAFRIFFFLKQYTILSFFANRCVK